MDADALISSTGLPVATFVYCVAAGLVPIVNAEIYLVAVAAAATPATLPWVVVMAAAGQMAAKLVLYYAGRGAVHLPIRRARASLDAVWARAERWRSKDLFFFSSATTGLPPFYATAVLAGTLRYPLGRFVVLGLLGRAIRFGAIVALPPVARWLVKGGG